MTLLFCLLSCGWQAVACLSAAQCLVSTVIVAADAKEVRWRRRNLNKMKQRRNRGTHPVASFVSAEDPFGRWTGVQWEAGSMGWSCTPCAVVSRSRGRVGMILTLRLKGHCWGHCCYWGKVVTAEWLGGWSMVWEKDYPLAYLLSILPTNLGCALGRGFP